MNTTETQVAKQWNAKKYDDIAEMKNARRVQTDERHIHKKHIDRLYGQ